MSLRKWCECLQKIAYVIYWVALTPFLIWSALIVIYSPVLDDYTFLNNSYVWLLAILIGLVIVFRRRLMFKISCGRHEKLNFYWGHFLPLFVFLGVYFSFEDVSPTNHAPWQISCSRNPTAQIKDHQLVIYNLRNFKYRTDSDFDAHWETRHYDLTQLEGMDLAVSHWSSDLIAHTMIVFRFKNPIDNIVLSVETRSMQHKEQDLLAGIFKGEHIIWILGTENDLLRLRTQYRQPNEDMYLYPLKITPDATRHVIARVVERINQLDQHPEFYNTLTQNCTTSLSILSMKAEGGLGEDIRTLINGYSDQMAFENKAFSDIQSDDSYVMYRAKHLVNLKLQGEMITDSNYSELIRKPFSFQK